MLRSQQTCIYCMNLLRMFDKVSTQETKTKSRWYRDILLIVIFHFVKQDKACWRLIQLSHKTSFDSSETRGHWPEDNGDAALKFVSIPIWTGAAHVFIWVHNFRAVQPRVGATRGHVGGCLLFAYHAILHHGVCRESYRNVWAILSRVEANASLYKSFLLLGKANSKVMCSCDN